MEEHTHTHTQLPALNCLQIKGFLKNPLTEYSDYILIHVVNPIINILSYRTSVYYLSGSSVLQLAVLYSL